MVLTTSFKNQEGISHLEVREVYYFCTYEILILSVLTVRWTSPCWQTFSGCMEINLKELRLFCFVNFQLTYKPVTDEQVFYDKFSYDKFYFTGVNVSTSLF